MGLKSHMARLGRAADTENRMARPRNLDRQLKDLGRAADLENRMARPGNLDWQLKGSGRAADLESRMARPGVVLSCSPPGGGFYRWAWLSPPSNLCLKQPLER